MLFENGIIGHLTGSYDATGPGGSYGLESLEVVGSDARFVLLDACEHLTFYPRRSHEIVTYDYVGGMMRFSETFGSRIGAWVEQNIAQVAPEEIDLDIRYETTPMAAVETMMIDCANSEVGKRLGLLSRQDNVRVVGQDKHLVCSCFLDGLQQLLDAGVHGLPAGDNDVSSQALKEPGQPWPR